MLQLQIDITFKPFGVLHGWIDGCCSFWLSASTYKELLASTIVAAARNPAVTVVVCVCGITVYLQLS